METKLRFKVGDKVKIIANTGGHSFEIGEDVEISHLGEEDYRAFNKDGDYWWVRCTDIEPIEPARKIKGYRLKDEYYKYSNAVEKIWSANGRILTFSHHELIGKTNAEILISVGVGHWIEPVYEEPEFTAKRLKVITMRCEGGSFEIEVSKKGIYYRTENAWLSVKDLKQILFTAVNLGSLDAGHTKYLVTTSSADFGCRKVVPIIDVRNLLEEYESICKL